MNKSFVKATVRGVFWTYSAFYLGKILVFASTVILARLLTQSDFGVVSFALLIIGFLDVINGAGLSSALIYYQEDERATHTAFWLDLGLGIIMMALTWYFAPFAGAYFDDDRIVQILRVLSFVFPIASLEDLPKVMLTRSLSFNAQFIPGTLHALVKGLTSIICAILGFGAWSLIYGHLAGILVSVIAFWRVVPWRPKFEMSTKWIRPIFSYGGGIVATNILSYILVNIDYLFVGYFLGAAALGIYTIAFKIPDLLIIQFCSLVGRVLFPVYAKMKDDPKTLSKAFLRTVNYVSLITIPLGLGLMLVAEPFVLTVFTDKWAAAIPVMRAISLYAIFLSLTYNASHAYKATGAISVMTGLSAGRAVVLVPALWWVSSKVGSIEAIGWTHAALAFIGASINLMVAGRVLNTSVWDIFNALRSAILAGGVMSVVVLAILYVSSSFAPWVQLLTGILSGILSYSLALAWIQKGIFVETWKMVLLSRSPDVSA
ncbi:MAG: lipopolysaccharide biosynthesis protein [Anaerolineales bacterium]|nr:lipopolysaccharide biosynthesis protein [Anaerolineales bacterium]